MIKYSAETLEKLENLYITEKMSVDDIATTLGLPKRSIIGKLSALGVYKTKQYTTKQGTKPISKSEYLEELALILGVTTDFLCSLEKANKNVLELLVSRLK